MQQQYTPSSQRAQVSAPPITDPIDLIWQAYRAKAITEDEMRALQAERMPRCRHCQTAAAVAYHEGYPTCADCFSARY